MEDVNIILSGKYEIVVNKDVIEKMESATADTIAGIFPASPITAAVGIANATAGNATASVTRSAADATVDTTMGNFPASPITTAARSAEATAGNAAASTTAFDADKTARLF